MSHVGLWMLVIAFFVIFVVSFSFVLFKIMPDAFCFGFRKNYTVVTAILARKHKELGVDNIVAGTPGHRPYWSAEYRYEYQHKMRTFLCDVLEEPPKQMQLRISGISGISVKPDGSMALRCCPKKGRSWIVYKDKDSIDLKILLLAAAPCILCLFVAFLFFLFL